jgi:hypothetical protein
MTMQLNSLLAFAPPPVPPALLQARTQLYKVPPYAPPALLVDELPMKMQLVEPQLYVPPPQYAVLAVKVQLVRVQESGASQFLAGLNEE